jgi:ribosomal protein S12 methylthiotransferase accessory factor
MKVDVEFGGGKKINAKFNGFTVESDQAVSAGGEGKFPEAFDYFDTALALCAGHYIMSFCEQREIPTDGIKISQDSEKDPDDKYKRFYTLNVELPSNFPDKYKRAVTMAASSCAVKKVVTTGPEFEINVTKRDL